MMYRSSLRSTQKLSAWCALGLLLSWGAPALAQDDGPSQGSEQRLTKAPKLKKAVEAQYPAEALQKRVEGAVKLRLTIDANGKVVEVEVLESPGAGLGEAAKLAASQFEFEPAEINNVPAAVTLGFAINFELPILPASFKAQVLDATSGQGLAGVEVTLEYTGPEALEQPVGKRAVTDAQGQVVLDELPAGSYKVRLRLDEYRDLETSIELVAGKTSEADYKVEAQPLNFVGQVREAGTRKALPGVQVQVEDAQGKLVREGFTDASGEFGFRGLAPGKYRARIKSQGYLASAYEEQIARDQLTRVTYYAEAEFYDEYTAQTVAMRERREVSKQVLKLEEVRRIPGTGGDVVRVIQNLPGVARPRFVSGAIIVRGSAPRDTQTFLEGDNIPLVFHFFAGPAVINSEMIESIDFYPGNFSAQYGRALAGIINLNTRDPKTDRVHGWAEVDVLNATALIEGPITENLSFALSGRRSYYDLFLNALIPEDTVDVVAAPYYWDYQAWLTYKGFKDSKLELFLYGSSDTVNLILPQNDPQGNADFQVTGLNLDNAFHRMQLRWEWKPTGPLENRLMVSYGTNTAAFEAAENLFFRGVYRQVQLRDELLMRLADNFKLRLGADMQLGNVTFSYEIPRFSEDGNDRGTARDGSGGGGRPNFGRDGAQGEATQPLMSPAVYAEADWEVIEGLTLIPGVRVDHFGQTSETAFSPRLSARWQLNKPVALKGGIGRFVQPPLPGATDPIFGNPQITYEKALHYSIGGEWRPLDYLEFDTTLFYRDTYDLVSNTSEFTVDEDGNTRPTIFSNEGQGRAYGAEILLRHYPQNRFFGWLAYTLSRSERKNLTTGKWQPFQFDQTHILTAVAGYNLPYGIDLSLRFRLVTGNPITPIVGGSYDVEQDRYLPVYGEPFSARNDPFRQLDLRIDKRWVFDTWILGAYLDIINVTWVDNAEGRRYNYDYTQSAPVLGLPIIPTLGVNARF